MNNYYEILGVSKNASEQEIKQSFRSLAMKHHPDRGGDAEQFQKIQEAYSVLGDPQKRTEYDSPQSQFHQGPGGFHFEFGGPGGFEQFFGNGNPFGDMFGFHRRGPTNQNIQLQTSISLEDAFNGKELFANVTLPSGKEQEINVKIPRGVHEGLTLKLSGIGDDRVPNAPRGDILLTVHIENHAKFKRSGDDLIQEVEINCIDAMTGCTITVEGIDNKILETTIPSGVQNETILGISGHGMPNFNNPSQRGRLLVKVKITIPKLTEDQKNLLKTMNIN